ncbi:MAG: hypothetical protein JWP44_5122 [Mucilaginibacter sp.]|nr:hypothetical protein [Mucilaginibacter sp.]
MGFFSQFQSILPKSFLNVSMARMTGVYFALGRQFDDLKAAILDAQNQIFIDSATWSLPIYEAEFSIKLVDTSNTAARRNNVMAMSRGGIGATPAAITSVLQSYGYSTHIVETFGTYNITIQFNDFRGIPSNINDLQNLLARFFPGHLQLNWQYLFRHYGEFSPYLQSQMAQLTHQQLTTTLPT